MSRRSAFLALALVTAAGAGAFILARAWGETVRQEAYLPDLRAMARRSPNDGRLLALLGARQAQAADYEVAAETLERAVAGGARHASVWLTWSAATAVTGNNVKAGAILRLGMRDNPSAAGHLRMAIDRVATLGPRPSPVALAMAICPEDTRPILAEYGRGSFLNEIAQWQGRRRPESSGFATREKWAQTEPKNPKVQLLWAQALLRNDRLPEAEETVEQVLKMDPKSPDALLVRGDVFFRGELFAKAALSYKEALRHRPDWFPALLGLGKATVEKKLIRISIETLEKATRLNPESADAWIGLGRAYFNQRFRFDKALAAFEQAARLAPERTDFFPYYSDVLRVNYRADEAEALLRRRVADAPEDARTQYLLALMLIDYKPSPERLAEAERALRTSIAIQPNVPSAQIRLGQLLLNQGKADEARQRFQIALEGEPNNSLAMRQLSRAYRRLGRAAEAKAAEERAVALSRYGQQVEQLEDAEHRNPADPKIHRQLAALYAKGGETEKARKQAEMAYMLENHKREATRGLSVLRAATSISVGAPDDPPGDAGGRKNPPAAAAAPAR